MHLPAHTERDTYAIGPAALRHPGETECFGKSGVGFDHPQFGFNGSHACGRLQRSVAGHTGTRHARLRHMPWISGKSSGSQRLGAGPRVSERVYTQSLDEDLVRNVDGEPQHSGDARKKAAACREKRIDPLHIDAFPSGRRVTKRATFTVPNDVVCNRRTQMASTLWSVL